MARTGTLIFGFKPHLFGDLAFHCGYDSATVPLTLSESAFIVNSYYNLTGG